MDNINKPSHYTKGKIEVIDFIEDQNLNFRLANVIKYVCRHQYKNGLEDLKKALWYLNREVKTMEEQKVKMEHEEESRKEIEQLEETCKTCEHYAEGDETICYECDKVSAKTMIRDMQMR